MLGKPEEHLVMNQADSYRKTQELRYIIDRTIPTSDYGKGCEYYGQLNVTLWDEITFFSYGVKCISL